MLKNILLLLALTISIQANAINIDLGAAKGYNLFIKENFSQPGADSQGKIAVGGNADIGQYDVGVNYDASLNVPGLDFWTDPNTYSDVLIVGGNLTTNQWSWGNVKGNLILGGSLTPGSSANSVKGTTTKGKPIDFNAAFTQLTALSLELAAKPQTAGIEFKYNNWLMLGGTSVDDVYVANVTGQMLKDVTDLTAPGIDNNDTLIINVSGKNITVDSLNYGIREHFAALDLSPSHILYNFYEAENITFSGGLKGNILAPNANFNFQHGDLSGQVIAKSWTGGWGAQANLWDGFFVPPQVPEPPTPPVVDVPESSSLALLFIALCCLVIARRKTL